MKDMEIKEQKSVREGGAESVLNLQPKSSLSFAYHSLFGPHDDLMLLELDDKLLPEILNQRVTLRGQPDEDAVFCTRSKTYGIKFVGTSNSVFLVPPADSTVTSQDCEQKDSGSMVVASVIKMAPGHMELHEVAPRLDKLKILLSQNPYGFDEASEMDVDSEENQKGLYTWQDLVEKIQASDEELLLGLEALSAVEIDGYWRIVEEEYMGSVLNMLLQDSVLNEWRLDALDEDKVVSALEADGFPRSIGRHCLQVHGTRLGDGVQGSCIWKLDEKRVCVHFAKGVLRRGKMKMGSFMEEWLRNVPEGMHPTFEMLEGEVLTEKMGIESWVYGFSVSSLPSAPAERFSILFHERQKWEWKDLQPYVRDLRVPGLSSEGLLLKYTRRTQPTTDAEPVFSAR